MFRRVVEREAAAGHDANVVQPHIFDRMTGQAGDDDRITRVDIRGDDVADRHAADRADRRALGPARAIAEAEENRGVRDLAHRDIRDRHVLDDRAVDALER